MNESLRVGLGFGLTSGVITTLGLMIGLAVGSESKAIVLAGILTIAIADALSDALGVHISKEAEGDDHDEVWKATGWTFLFKFLVALSFVIPIVSLDLINAIQVSILYAFALLGTFSYFLAKWNKESPFKVITEHILITFVVIVLSYFVGSWINTVFV